MTATQDGVTSVSHVELHPQRLKLVHLRKYEQFYIRVIAMDEIYKKKQINPPMAILFNLFERFDEVPLPDGHIYKLSFNKLLIKTVEEWIPSDMQLNELLNMTSDLTASDWRNLLQGCVGDDNANAWREKIQALSLAWTTRFQ